MADAPAGQARRVVTLADEDDADGFRVAARGLLGEAVEPDAIEWRVATAAAGELFGGVGPVEAANPTPGTLPGEVSDATPPSASRSGPRSRSESASASAAPSAPGAAPAVIPIPAGKAEGPSPTGEARAQVTVPAFFIPLCEQAALHADPGRFGLLYRLAWRLRREPSLRHDPLDPDRQAAEAMARAVRHEMHKMTAFVRFRPVAAAADDPAGVDHIAWFEPVHHVVVATAPFFARRFAQMRWAILTPDRSVRWNGSELTFGPGGDRRDAPAADAGEALWLTYYGSIFNPARLKLAMMQKEMPRRYWKNLPEAALIQPLTASAQARTGQMIEQPASEPVRRRPAASTALRLDAREAVVHAPATLADLADSIEQCRECPIGALATQAVPGAGPREAPLMLVGEQPGDQEDLCGHPFVGPAGQLLDRAMQQLGWPRERLYVTNAVKHFKFELRGKRRIHKTPAQQEVAACLHWLESEIAIVAPAAVVALGATAARALMGRTVAVTKERGQWLTRADGLRVLITLHPSALLRVDPADKETAYAAWLEDLKHATREWGDTVPKQGGAG